MINPKGYSVFYLTVIILCTACASTTFTQEGEVSDENICYANKCYTTIYWEDGTFSNIEDDFLPTTKIVFRHCYLTPAKKIICRPTIYEQPIRLFDKSFEEVIEQQ